MSKNKKDRAKSSQGGGADAAKWEQGIINTSLNEDDQWWSSITFLVGRQIEDYVNIDTIASAVNGGTRRLFSVVSRDQLYEQVRDLGNPKSKKGKDTPAFFEVCEPCKLHLDNEEDIPLPLLAKLLKFKLLDVKQKDLKRREAERKAASEKDKGGKGGKGDKKERGKSPKKGGGKKTPEPPSAKEGTKLKKRGEEDLDSKYLDDEPDDGPQHYILVYGFNHPHIFSHLADIGVNVDAVIRVSSEDYSRFEIPQENLDGLADEPVKDEKTLALEEDLRRKKKRGRRELKHFWKDLLPILQRAAEGSSLNDIARLEYVVKCLLVPENPEDNEEKLRFGADMFEDIACIIYDLLDAKRQYKNYLNNLRLLEVPLHGQPSQTPQPADAQSQPSVTPAAPQKDAASTVQDTETRAVAEVDMRTYKELMDMVPNESASVPLIVHSMLEQVCASEEDRPPPSATPKPPRDDGLDHELATHLGGLAFKLALSEEEQQMLGQDFDTPKRSEPISKEPQLMNPHDDITRRLQHVKGINSFDPKSVELDMLKKLPLAHLQNLPRPTSRLAKERSARLQELIHFCATGGLTQAEIDRAFKQFVFECMDLTGTDLNGFISTQPGPGVDISVIPWDDPYPFFCGMVTKEEQLEELMEILSASRSEVEEVRSGAKSPSPVELPSTPSPQQEPADSEDGSRPPSRGILKPSSRSGSPASRKSSAHSVQFDAEAEETPREPPAQTEDEPERTTEETIEEIVDSQKRNLNHFCFAEHFQPEVLLQVLKDASYSLPYMDAYYHKRDHSLLVVLHNPYNSKLQSHATWQTNLHSNVGFRNYLEHVAASIDEWTHTEESKYEAQQLAKEVEQIQKEASESSSRPASGKKRDRSKSPRKSPSRKTPRSRPSSAERPKSSNPFIRPNSLKAQKEEMDRIRAEEEAKEREKADKRARSASKRASKDKVVQDDKKDKKPGSRSGSAKSRSSKDQAEQPTDETGGQDQAQEEEKFWPFTGYNTGDKLIHASGIVSTLFPADGGQIRTERLDFIQGQTSVKTSVLKDGHVFTLHVLDPKLKGDEEEEDEDDAEEKKDEAEDVAEAENSEKEGRQTPEQPKVEEPPKPKKPCIGSFGSFSAQLNDGISLSFSTYGGQGEPEDGKPYEPAPYIAPPPRTPTPTQPTKESPSKRSKSTSKDKPAASPAEEMTEVESAPEEKVEEPVIEQPFQELCVASPDGLNIMYCLESSMGVVPENEDDRRILVRQSYPFKTAGRQACEAARRHAMEEASRIIKNDGTVIKTMNDGTVQILYADGTVSRSLEPIPTPTSRPSSPQRSGSAKSGTESPTRKGRVSRRPSAQKENIEPTGDDEDMRKVLWVTTKQSGEKILTRRDGTSEVDDNALVCMATDPQTNQVMVTRDDHVIMVAYPDGATVVEFADGTRITLSHKQLEIPNLSSDAEETGESMPTTIQEVKLVQVECPGYATLRFDHGDNICTTEFGNGTQVDTFPSGQYEIFPAGGGRLLVDSDATSKYYPQACQTVEFTDQEHVYTMKHYADVVFETTDQDGNVFTVCNTGMTSVVTSSGSEITGEEAGEEESDDGRITQKKLVVYKQHTPRFFIIHGDGSGSELLRYQDVATYINDAEDDPLTAVLMDPIPDYPGVLGITVLKPIKYGISDAWLNCYKLDNVIPPGLTSRDLKSLPAREFKTDGPTFGSTLGRGLAVGSARKQNPVPLILQCPSVLEMRQLVQYKPVSDELRTKLTAGLKEYAEFVRERNESTDSLLVVDPRTNEEKMHASDLLATAQKSDTPRQDAVNAGDVKAMYEKATAVPAPSPPPTPQPKRTKADWERDQRELAQEAEGRRALRHQDVPRYFDSEFGKAFLLSQAPDMEALARELAEDPRQDESRAIRSANQTTPSESAQSSSAAPQDPPTSAAELSEGSGSQPCTAPHSQDTPSPQHGPVGNTPCKLRPGNPTPFHAEGRGSPVAVRPGNPTPSHGTTVVSDRPGAPTPKGASGVRNTVSESPSSHAYPSIQERPLEEEGTELPQNTSGNMSRSRLIETDVIGQARKEPVHVPAFLKGGRPNAAPNERFNMVEDPVRRKVFTSSIAGATDKGRETLTSMRGFELLPSRVHFGVLKEGYTYTFVVYLKNTGTEACRFKIRQPPPSTGLKVIYKPGPIAAGMKAELCLELYAIAVGVEGDSGIGGISHNLQITTETDQLFLPVTATVLTADEFDKHSPCSPPRSSKSAGVKLVSTKPPGVQGIIRPRRETGDEVEVK